MNKSILVGAAFLVATVTVSGSIAQPLAPSAQSQESRSAGSYLHDLCDELSSKAAWAKDWRCLDAGIFDNGTTPQRIYDLRQRDRASLTDEEKAILIAADKVGNIRFCHSSAGNEGSAGNAFLIKYRGQPAIIASGHLLIDFKTGKSRCPERTQFEYYPNTSYYNPFDPSEKSSFYLRIIVARTAAAEISRLQQLKGEFNTDEDYLILYLDEDPTKDVMPNGNVRSFFRDSTNKLQSGKGVYMIGLGADPEGMNLAMLYQTGCNYHRDYDRLNHDCASINGSSGGILGFMEGGEIVFAGIHRYAIVANTHMPGPSEGYASMWNVATSVHYVRSKEN